MLHKIESLRKQPKAVRNRYALYGAVISTSVIALFWLVSVPSQLTPPDGVSLLNDEAADQSGGFSRALNDLRGQVASVFDSVDELTSSSTDAAANTVEFDREIVRNYFGTSSTPEDIEIQPSGARTVLIGTTSASSTP